MPSGFRPDGKTLDPAYSFPAMGSHLPLTAFPMLPNTSSICTTILRACHRALSQAQVNERLRSAARERYRAKPHRSQMRLKTTPSE